MVKGSIARKVAPRLVSGGRYVSCEATLWIEKVQTDVAVHLSGHFYAGSHSHWDPPEIDDLECTAAEDVLDENGRVVLRKGEAITLDPKAEEEGREKLLASIDRSQ